MNRRESLKTLGIGAVATGLLVEAACKPGTQKQAEDNAAAVCPGKKAPADPSRLPNEIERDKKLSSTKFFTEHEMATITVLVDIIIPKDEKSGSAADAKVPEFIEFMANDDPDNQTPIRGGLRWLDMQCFNRYNNCFKDCTPEQQVEMVSMIAYPKKFKPEMAAGVTFFTRMRDLTATGFFTSEIGVKDIGYMGNTP